MQVYLPDKDDDRGSLGHGSNHAAHTDDTQEGEEGLLTARTGTFSWQSHSLLAVAGYTRTAAQVLAKKKRERERQGMTISLAIILSCMYVCERHGSLDASCPFTHWFGAASKAGGEVGDSVGATDGTDWRCVAVAVADAHGLRPLPRLQCPRQEVKGQNGLGLVFC